MPLQRLASAPAASRETLLSLQGATGNRAVQRLLNETTEVEEDVATESPELFNVPDAHLPAPGGGSEIPDQLRRGMEGALGQDFSDVRVHTDSSPDSVGALAYTQGSDVHFRPGMYQPDSQSGREAIGHELAHVVQQRAGRVATPQGMGAPVNADPSLEAEADAIGRQAARAIDSGAALAEPAAAPASTVEAPAQRIAAPVQRVVFHGRQRRASVEALEQRQLVSQSPFMAGGGGGGGAGAAQAVADAPGVEAPTTPAPAPAEMTGGAQAVADATPATDEATGAPEGAAEAVTSLGSDAGPMAAALEEMAAEVGPDNVLSTLEEQGEEDEAEDMGADTSGLTSVPSSASGIADTLGMQPPASIAPVLAQATASVETPSSAPASGGSSPVSEEMSMDEWEAMMTEGGRGAPAPASAPATPTASAPESMDAWTDRYVRGRLDARGGRERSNAIGQGIDVGAGDSTVGTVGDAFTGTGAGGAIVGGAAPLTQSIAGGSALGAGITSQIAGGGVGGLAGGVASVLDAGLSAGRAHVGGGAMMAEEGARAASGLTSAASSASNAAVGIEAARIGSAGLGTTSGVAANALMTGAGTAAAGLSVATGSIDIVRGIGSAYAASGRADQLQETATARAGTAVGDAAAGAAESQRQRVVEGGVTVGKGALSVAGGAILLALGLTNPVGLGLLAGAALVGGAYALYKLWRSKKKKNAKIGGGQKTEGAAKAELAATLFTRGVAEGDPEYQAIVVQLGFSAEKVTKGVKGGITQAHILARIS